MVVPELKQERPRLYKQVLADMHKDRFQGNEEESRMEFEKRVKPAVRRVMIQEHTAFLTVL